MGFFDRAKKLAEQAKDKAEEALAEARSRSGAAGEGSMSTTGRPAPPPGGDPRLGTPYVPGMLGRPGWREQGLTDPAAMVPIAVRDRLGVPRSTRSEIVEEPFGMGRRWTNDGRSVGLFYQLYPEHQSWQPPGGLAPSADLGQASSTSLPDGRTLVFLAAADRRVVLEVAGLDAAARADLARAVAEQLANG